MFRYIIYSLLMLSSAAAAEDRAPSISYEYELAAVSDYRFRGVSYSDGRPAVQGGATASLKGGAYGSIWASSIEEYGGGADGKGATVELDYTVGQAFKSGPYDVDIGASLYTFPGGESVNYLEIPVTVSRAAGPWTWTLGAAYAPKQGALPNEDNSYAFGRVLWARDDGLLSLSGTAGYERGAFAPHGKWDWSATLSRVMGLLEASLSFVAVEEGFGDDTLLASLKATF